MSENVGPQEEASVTPSGGCGGCCGLVWPKCPGPGARAVTKGLCFVPPLSAGLEGLIPCPGISLAPLTATGVQQAQVLPSAGGQIHCVKASLEK